MDKYVGRKIDRYGKAERDKKKFINRPKYKRQICNINQQEISIALTGTKTRQRCLQSLKIDLRDVQAVILLSRMVTCFCMNSKEITATLDESAKKLHLSYPIVDDRPQLMGKLQSI